MSHFTVLVIGDDVAGQLAPYDENIEVEPYWDDCGSFPSASTFDLPEAATAEQIVAVANEKWGDESKYRVGPEGQIQNETTYNPKSKWDWYQVGGRCAGFFKVRVFENEQERWHAIHDAAVAGGGMGRVEAISEADRAVVLSRTPVKGEAGLMGAEMGLDADVLYRIDVDIDWMRHDAAVRAGEWWDAVDAILGELPEALPWAHFMTPETKGKEAIEEARDAYWAQPRCVAVAHAQEHRDQMLFGFMGDGVDEYQMGRDAYVERGRLGAGVPYAYVQGGQWFAKGEMGWFGMGSDNEQDGQTFARNFGEMFDGLPPDTLLTLVDCHI